MINDQTNECQTGDDNNIERSAGRDNGDASIPKGAAPAWESRAIKTADETARPIHFGARKQTRAHCQHKLGRRLYKHANRRHNKRDTARQVPIKLPSNYGESIKRGTEWLRWDALHLRRWLASVFKTNSAGNRCPFNNGTRSVPASRGLSRVDSIKLTPADVRSMQVDRLAFESHFSRHIKVDTYVCFSLKFKRNTCIASEYFILTIKIANRMSTLKEHSCSIVFMKRSGIYFHNKRRH